MPETPTDSPSVQLTLRLEPEILARVEAHADRLRRTNPGLPVTRAGALRALVVEALTRAEGAPGSAPATR